MVDITHIMDEKGEWTSGKIYELAQDIKTRLAIVTGTAEFHKAWRECEQSDSPDTIGLFDMFDTAVAEIIKICWDQAPLPEGIQQALNSGDGTYRP